LKEKILVVEDQDVNRRLLVGMFKDEYVILEAEDGEAAIDILTEHAQEIAVVLLDLLMPKVDGFGVLTYMKHTKLLDRVPVVIITGEDSTATKQKAFEMGAYDIISKPYDVFIVTKRIKNLVKLWENEQHLEQVLLEKTEELRRTSEAMLKFGEKMTETLGNVSEFRAAGNFRHIQRVKVITGLVAEKVATYFPEYHLEEKDVEYTKNASAIHDIGKAAVPEVILFKPTKLTPQEEEILAIHCAKGAEIIRGMAGENPSPFMQYCLDIVQYHHERYDGNGVPYKLIGDEIPIAAQIVGVADEFDTMISSRIYGAIYEPDRAFDMILEGDRGIFNPKVMHCFEAAREEIMKAVNELKDVE
jgi:putative two-component system response regulator